MHGKPVLGGFIYLILVVLKWIVPLGAVFVCLDALRRPSQDFAGRLRPVARLGWILPQLAFLGLVLVGNSLAPTPGTGMAVIVAVPLALGLQIAYLLRVVFPSPKRIEARREAEEDD